MSLSPSGRARLRVCAVAVLAVLGLSHAARAQCPTVIRVPQDAPSINAAVAQVCAGTTAEIVVAAGTWPATLTAAQGSIITVRGADRTLTTVVPETDGRFVASAIGATAAARVTFSDLTLREGAPATANWRTSLTRCDVVECDGTFFPEGVIVQDTRFIDCQPVGWSAINTPATLYLQPDTQVLRCEFNECFRPVLLWGEGGALGHRLIDCTFSSCTGNHVTIRSSCCAGGANRARIERCTFDDTAGGSGVAIAFEASQAAGAQTPVLQVVDCVFRSVGQTDPSSAGGAIRIGTPGFDYPSAMSSTVISSSTFTACHAGSGGAIFLSKYQPLTLINCMFTGNSATDGPGGALAQEFGGYSQSFSASGCTFIGNSAAGDGGALRLGGWSGTADIAFCSFSYNSGASGGAVHVDRRATTIRLSQFIENVAHLEDGGAHYQDLGSLEVVDCTFVGNTSNRYGGALNIYSFVNPASVSGSSFQRNSAEVEGGALAIGRELNATVSSCSFAGNQAGQRAAAARVFDPATAVAFTNCTAFENGLQTGSLQPAFLAMGEANLSVASSWLCGSGVPAWGGVDGGTATDGGGNCVAATCADVDSNGLPDACQVVSVPGDFPTIQAAINGVPAGSYRVIALAPGTYPGPINLDGKRVAIMGSGAATTIIDGTGGADTSVVRAVGEPAGARIDGVTIRGGQTGSPLPGLPSARVGGGIFGDGSALVVSNCVIEGNVAGFGAGAYFRDCTGAVIDCIVRNNSAVGEGGGLQISAGSMGVERTLVEDNIASGRGGGIHLTNGDMVLRQVDIIGNHSGSVVGGLSFITLTTLDSPPGALLVEDCTIEGNTAVVAQGGVGILDDTPQTDQVIFSGTRACLNSPSPNISGQWFNAGGNEICDCRPDINFDGRIDGVDLAALLSQWGPATQSSTCDFNGSGAVDATDLSFLLAAWGECGISSQISVSGISPASGPLAGGTTITISGANLLGVTAVRVGGVLATNVQVVDSATVTAVTPPGNAGVRDVSVATSSATVTLPAAFTYATRTVPSWATLVEPLPPAGIVTSQALRDAIDATGYAWRVRDNATQIEMVLIPGGSFTMGCSASNQFGCGGTEIPTHPVTLTQAFYLGRYEVTQAQWTAVIGANPSLFHNQPDSPNRPVEQVSWFTLQPFLSKTGMRLPTEAEWEYAYRAGTSTAYHGFVLDGFTGYTQGTNVDSLTENIAWFSANGNWQTHAVGQKAGNGFGLHDMSGNVWEWASDWFGIYPATPQTNPTGPSTGTRRVIRGGCWSDTSGNVRASVRYDAAPGTIDYAVGFRVARNPE